MTYLAYACSCRMTMSYFSSRERGTNKQAVPSAVRRSTTMIRLCSTDGHDVVRWRPPGRRRCCALMCFSAVSRSSDLHEADTTHHYAALTHYFHWMSNRKRRIVWTPLMQLASLASFSEFKATFWPGELFFSW